MEDINSFMGSFLKPKLANITIPRLVNPASKQNEGFFFLKPNGYGRGQIIFVDPQIGGPGWDSTKLMPTIKLTMPLIISP